MRSPSISGLSCSQATKAFSHHHYHQAEYITMSAYIACILLCSTTPPHPVTKRAARPKTPATAGTTAARGQTTPHGFCHELGWAMAFPTRTSSRSLSATVWCQGCCVGPNCARPPAEVELTQRGNDNGSLATTPPRSCNDTACRARRDG